MPADPSIVVSGHVSDLPFHPPATDDKRDAELAFVRLDKKIAGSVTRVTTLEAGLTTANASIATNTTNIATNTTNVATNTTNIGTNTTNIATNTTNIATNTTNIATNTTNIATITTALATKVDETTIAAASVPYNASTGVVTGGYGVATGTTYTYLNINDWNNSNLDNFFDNQFFFIHQNILHLQTKINAIITAIG